MNWTSDTEATSGTAAQQLRAIQTGDSAGREIGRAGRLHDSLYGAAVGVFVEAMVAALVFIFPTSQPWLVGPSTVVFGVGVGVAAAIYRMHRTATSRGTARRYRIGFLATMSLYAIGAVLRVVEVALPLWFWIPLIVSTAVPITIASVLGASRDR